MNYISLRFISSAVASFPPFMIVFNPHHIFIQNKYPPTHNPLHDTLRSAGRGRRNVSAKVERGGGDVKMCQHSRLSLFSDDILDKTFS